MRKLRPVLFLLLAFGHPLHGADIETELLEQTRLQDIAPPRIDAKKLVKQSSSFLREREPEMSSEEYALYEQVVTMLTNNPQFAVRMLEAMMTGKEPVSPAFEFILGNAYYAANQPELSEKHYRSSVQRYPSFLRAWKNLGVLLYTTNRFDDAAKCFSKAVVLGDREPTTFGLLGYSLEKQGNLVSAEMAYLQALGGDPASSDWKEGLVRIYIDGRQYGRAEPLVRNLIKERPTETRLWLNYASLLVSDRRKLEAIAVLEAAQAAGAAGPEELSLLGDLFAEQGLSTEAIATYTKVLGPERPRGEQKLLQLARMLIDTGNHPKAEQTLAAITGDLTSSSRVLLLQTRADLFRAQKRWPDARREIESLLALAPLNGRALLTLGRIHLEEHDVPRATFAFETAYRIPESAYHASLELANIELKNRRYAKAVAYLEHALGLQRSEAVEDYLARIKTLVPADPGAG
jgi:tetratricopeptide (TPR) repeat protein